MMKSVSFVILFLSELICLSTSYQRFIQISDLHLDLGYSPGSNVKNNCHNSSSVLAEDEGGASKYGDFRCDSPKKLVLSAIRYLQKIEPNPDFILWTGDSSPHWWDDEEHNWDEVYNNLKLVTRELHTRFPNATILPALGNHDSHPADFFADPAINSSFAKQIYSGYIEQGSLGDLLRDYPEAKSKFKECGYYSVKKKNYFKENITQTFIVLNTNLYYVNKAKTNETDPCGQFKWLETELRNAKDNERIFIVAHVPPGFFELSPQHPFFDTYNHTQMFTQILSEKKAAQKIVAHFYGHMHTDAIRLFLDSEGEARGIGFAAPSVTPLMYEGGVNPSVRIYDYNPENRTIVNYETHYLPLDRLLVHETSGASREEVTEASDVTGNDDDESTTNGEAKSRRKNSKFLDREQRQAPTSTATTVTSTTTMGTKSATASSSNSTTDNGDDTFEKLATEPSTTKMLKSEAVTIHPEEEAESTTPVERDETTIKTLSAIQSSKDVAIDNQTTSTDNSTTSLSTNADPDVDFLVSQWTLGYNKQPDLGVEDLSPKSVFNAYLTMKQDRENSKFKSYHRQTWVLHDPVDRIGCNETCHAIFMCAMVHFTSEDFGDCLLGFGHVIATPSTTEAATTTTSSSTTSITSFVNYQRTTSSYSWARTTSAPSSLTTSRSYNSFVHDDPEIGIESSDSDKQGESGVVRGIAIGFAGIALIAIAGFSFAFYRKSRINRYRSQEFLLTDSVFRYDGYSQVDQP